MAFGVLAHLMGGRDEAKTIGAANEASTAQEPTADSKQATETDHRIHLTTVRPNATAKRHKNKSLTGQASVYKRWGLPRMRRLIQRGGAVFVTQDAVHVAAVVMQAILEEGLDASTIYAGLHDSDKSLTLKNDHVRLGFAQRLGQTILT